MYFKMSATVNLKKKHNFSKLSWNNTASLETILIKCKKKGSSQCNVHKRCSQCRRPFCNLIQTLMTVRTGWNAYVAYGLLPNIQWCDGDSLTNQLVTQYTRFESVTTVKIHPEDCLLCSWLWNRVVPYRFSEAHAACIFRAETAPQ
jgi:hypothetical protein